MGVVTNNMASYGGAQTFRRVVLFVFLPDKVDKNTLGDIIAIRDSSGNIVATYEYDAWGNCKVIDAYRRVNTSNSFMGRKLLISRKK